MRNLFFVILLATLSSVSLAHAGGKRHIAAQAGCGVKCEFHKHARGTGLKPAIRNEVCFRFTQNGTNFVTLTLYDVYAGPQSPRNHILRLIKHKVPDGPEGQFCLGATTWVSKAVFVDICNDINHSDRGIPSLREGLRSGVVQMCLRGRACSRFVQ